MAKNTNAEPTVEARCIRAYLKRAGKQPNTPVTFGDLLAIEDHYSIHGEPSETPKQSER
jgi:hypothetical protein